MTIEFIQQSQEAIIQQLPQQRLDFGSDQNIVISSSSSTQQRSNPRMTYCAAEDLTENCQCRRCV